MMMIENVVHILIRRTCLGLADDGSRTAGRGKVGKRRSMSGNPVVPADVSGRHRCMEISFAGSKIFVVTTFCKNQTLLLEQLIIYVIRRLNT